MAQSKRILGFSLTTLLAAGTCLTAMTAGMTLLTNSETLLRSSFGSALVASSETPASVRAPKSVPLAGS